MSAEAEALLEFWFGDHLGSAEKLEAGNRRWFGGGPEFDAALGARFAALPARAARGELDGWRAGARTSLALVLVLDQLPRNLYRGDARAFELDPRARAEAEAAIAKGFDARLHPVEASFLYLPLEHAEDRAAQARCVALFEALVEGADASLRGPLESYLAYARRHQRVIDRFGRFPHRNETLGRVPTEAERRYLAEGGDRF